MHAVVDDIRALDTPIDRHVVIDHGVPMTARLDGAPLAIPARRM
jgi:hypothetical protein